MYKEHLLLHQFLLWLLVSTESSLGVKGKEESFFYIKNPKKKAEVIAIEDTAEKILQTTTTDMLQLHNKGQRVDIQPVKARLIGKTFFMLLRRAFSKNNKIQRCLMLISYNEETGSTHPPLPTSKPQTIASPSTGIHSSSYAGETELPLSPLKRQLSQVAISSGSTTKRQLIWNEAHQDEGNSSNENTKG